MFLTRHVIAGLRALANSSSAKLTEHRLRGEHETLAVKRYWSAVDEAIAWVDSLRHGGEVVVRLTPVEATRLAEWAEKGWRNGGCGLGLTATPIRQSRRALQKLADARADFEKDRQRLT